ncbi:MAG: hypothetical protein KDK70_19315 [Myxococcales bacterium]|nr:hypothetical protein [Myxococcales bacterium]
MPACPEPYDQCVQPGGLGSWCTFGCQDASECPEPTDGDAVPFCGGPPNQPTVCMLDCSMGTCPAGMECVGLGPGGMAMRCVWPFR